MDKICIKNKFESCLQVAPYANTEILHPILQYSENHIYFRLASLIFTSEERTRYSIKDA